MKRRTLSLVTLGGYAALVVAALFWSPRDAGGQGGAASVAGGRKLYQQYCASCHGLDAKGHGPAAEALRTAPPDLTLIQKEGEKFPSQRVIDSIEGDRLVAAHGNRQMPVWGRVFRQAKGGKLKEPVYVYNLVNYLESIQAKNYTHR